MLGATQLNGLTVNNDVLVFAVLDVVNGEGHRRNIAGLGCTGRVACNRQHRAGKDRDLIENLNRLAKLGLLGVDIVIADVRRRNVVGDRPHKGDCGGVFVGCFLLWSDPFAGHPVIDGLSQFTTTSALGDARHANFKFAGVIKRIGTGVAIGHARHRTLGLGVAHRFVDR